MIGCLYHQFFSFASHYPSFITAIRRIFPPLIISLLFYHVLHQYAFHNRHSELLSFLSCSIIHGCLHSGHSSVDLIYSFHGQLSESLFPIFLSHYPRTFIIQSFLSVSSLFLLWLPFGAVVRPPLANTFIVVVFLWVPRPADVLRILTKAVCCWRSLRGVLRYTESGSSCRILKNPLNSRDSL